MTLEEVIQYIRSHTLAVEASVTQHDAPQAAVVGFAVTDDLQIVFDTLHVSRKAQNLRKNSRIAFVIGGLTGGDERTVQYEGIADEPAGNELESLKELYFAVFPDGRQRQNWPGLIYIRAKPLWIRYSDYNQNPPEIVEFDFRKGANPR